VPNPGQIFVSYSRKDRAWVRALRFLANPDFGNPAAFWIDDEQMMAGEVWTKKVEEAICESRAAVLIVSNQLEESSAVLEQELPAIMRMRSQRQSPEDSFKLLLLPVGNPKISVRQMIADKLGLSDVRHLLSIVDWEELPADPKDASDAVLQKVSRLVIESMDAPDILRLRKVLPPNLEILNDVPSETGKSTRIVFANDTAIDRMVVIKSLRSDTDSDKFRDDVRRMSVLSCHPNAVPVYSASFSQRPYFYVREYIKGDSLEQHIDARESGFPVDFVRVILQGVGSLTAFAVAQQIEDLCLRPNSIFIRKSARYQRVSGITTADVKVCAWPHNEREQLSHSDSADADYQYQLGKLAYRLLVGKSAFLRAEKKVEQRDGHVIWPDIGLNTGISCPRSVKDAVSRMLRLSSHERFPSIQAALNSISGGNQTLELARERSVTALAAVTPGGELG